MSGNRRAKRIVDDEENDGQEQAPQDMDSAEEKKSTTTTTTKKKKKTAAPKATPKPEATPDDPEATENEDEEEEKHAWRKKKQKSEKKQKPDSDDEGSGADSDPHDFLLTDVIEADVKAQCEKRDWDIERKPDGPRWRVFRMSGEIKADDLWASVIGRKDVFTAVSRKTKRRETFALHRASMGAEVQILIPSIDQATKASRAWENLGSTTTVTGIQRSQAYKKDDAFKVDNVHSKGANGQPIPHACWQYYNKLLSDREKAAAKKAEKEKSASSSSSSSSSAAASSKKRKAAGTGKTSEAKAEAKPKAKAKPADALMLATEKQDGGLASRQKTSREADTKKTQSLVALYRKLSPEHAEVMDALFELNAATSAVAVGVLNNAGQLSNLAARIVELRAWQKDPKGKSLSAATGCPDWVIAMMYVITTHGGADLAEHFVGLQAVVVEEKNKINEKGKEKEKEKEKNGKEEKKAVPVAPAATVVPNGTHSKGQTKATAPAAAAAPVAAKAGRPPAAAASGPVATTAPAASSKKTDATTPPVGVSLDLAEARKIVKAKEAELAAAQKLIEEDAKAKKEEADAHKLVEELQAIALAEKKKAQQAELKAAKPRVEPVKAVEPETQAQDGEEEEEEEDDSTPTTPAAAAAPSLPPPLPALPEIPQPAAASPAVNEGEMEAV